MLNTARSTRCFPSLTTIAFNEMKMTHHRLIIPIALVPFVQGKG